MRSLHSDRDRSALNKELRIAMNRVNGQRRQDGIRNRPFEIPRVAIEAADSMSAFRLKVAGVLPMIDAARRRGRPR